MLRFVAVTIATSTMIMLTAASPASAQTVSKGQLSGTVKGGSAVLPPSGSAGVYTTPASTEGFFILTQACSANGGCIALNGSTVGRIPLAGGDTCMTFSPGIALPAAEILTATESCSQPNYYVTVTGVLSKK